MAVTTDKKNPIPEATVPVNKNNIKLTKAQFVAQERQRREEEAEIEKFRQQLRQKSVTGADVAPADTDSKEEEPEDKKYGKKAKR